MLNDFNCTCPVYIACGYTDLRRGIDGLAGIVRTQFQMDPFQTALFLFCGRRRDRIKALYWEGDGFLLLYKRLESGSFQWPRTKDEVRTLTPQQYRWLIKPFVMGRKNWLFANTPAGAQSSAVIYSLIETAKENELDPYRYLLWVLQSAPVLSQADEFWAEKLLPTNAPQECHVPQ